MPSGNSKTLFTDFMHCGIRYSKVNIQKFFDVNKKNDSFVFKTYRCPKTAISTARILLDISSSTTLCKVSITFKKTWFWCKKVSRPIAQGFTSKLRPNWPFITVWILKSKALLVTVTLSGEEAPGSTSPVLALVKYSEFEIIGESNSCRNSKSFQLSKAVTGLACKVFERIN